MICNSGRVADIPLVLRSLLRPKGFPQPFGRFYVGAMREPGEGA